MAAYAFITRWDIHAPIQRVWDAIYHSESWSRWWKGVESVVELQPGDPNGVGSVRRYTWKSRLPYALTFEMRTVRVEPLIALESLASGELTGRGLWRFSHLDDGTSVRYEWNVQTTTRWMNLLTPVARPLFAWNHDVVMRWGEEGLKRLLEVT